MAKYSSLCVDFNGSTKYASAGNVLDKIHTDSFSIAAWVKTDDDGDIISKVDGGGVGYSLRIVGSSGRLTLADGGGGVLDVDAFFAVHGTNNVRWRYIVATYDGSTNASGALLYYDGRPMRKTTVTDTLSATISNTGSLTIAGRNAVANLGSATVGNGLIDNVAIFTGVLTPAEVLASYNHRRPMDYSLLSLSTASLDGHWRMGDGATHPTIPDERGSNDMTLSGTTAADILDHRTAGGYPVMSMSLGEPGGTVPVFKMRGRDNGRTPGSDYIVWIHTGSEPDFAGAGFSGGTPTPIGSLVPGSVVMVAEI